MAASREPSHCGTSDGDPEKSRETTTSRGEAWNSEEPNWETPSYRHSSEPRGLGSGLPVAATKQPFEEPGWAADLDCDSKVASSVNIMGMPKSFHRLLMELAAEHQRELKQLREDFEQRLATSKPCLSNQVTTTTEAPDEEGDITPDQLHQQPGPLCKPSSSWGSRSFGAGTADGSSVAEASRSFSRRRTSVFDLEDEVDGKPTTDSRPTEAGMQVTGLPVLCRARSYSARRMCETFVKTQSFDTICVVAIITNSILLGWSANHSINMALDGKPPDIMPLPVSVLTIGFMIWFTLELVVRFLAAGPRNFLSRDDWSWNVFDIVVVGSDLVQFILDMLSVNMQGGIGIQNVTVARMLRVLRIARAIRVVRLVRFFRELRMMVFSVLRSGYSLLWSLLMLSATIYVFGVYFIQIVAYHFDFIGRSGGPDLAPETRQLLEVFFGNLLRAQYTLYQAVSGGINWGEVSQPLMEIDTMHGFVFSFFTFFTTFALMNIITGIFVDSAIHSAQSDKDEVIQEQLHSRTQGLHEMKRIFQTADTDGSGEITLKEFEEHLSDTEVTAYLASMGIETDRARGLFRLLDVDDSGQITVEEFVYGCMRLKGAAKSIDLATLMLENNKMVQQWKCFFEWSEEQFRGLNQFKARVDERLTSLLGDGEGAGTR